MLRQYKLRDYNFRLVLWVVSLCVLGILLVNSAEESLMLKQTLGVISGLIIMVVLSLIDFSWILNFTWLVYAFDILLLIGVILVGKTAGGATRWFEIAGFRFQPVEPTKIAMVIFFARFFMQHENDVSTMKTLLKSIGLIGLPLALVFAQPDLKNTITILMIFAVMYYIAGLSYQKILGIVVIAAVGMGIFFALLMQPDIKIINDYQKNRIMGFLNQDDNEYSEQNSQQNNSVTAIGSGMLTGKGLNNSSVSSANKGNFVPEIQTDFIFAVAGEELGFLGSAGIVILLLLIVLECLYISRRAKDLSGRIICCGVSSLIAFQSFINIGVATHILPNTGTPLPFVSYGLTSLWSLLIGIGLVLNVGLQNKIRVMPVGVVRTRRARA